LRARKIREKTKLINMTKSLNIKTLVLSAILLAGVLLPFASNAQGTDLFFRVDNDDIYNNRDEADNLFSVTIGGMQNEELPLGSGLLIMVAAGAGYVVARRKRAMKNGTTLLLIFALMLGMTQCKKQVETVATNSVEKVSMTLDAGYGNSRTVFVPGEDSSGFTWSTTDNEYVYIGGSDSGYLGCLTAEPQSSTTSTTEPIVFSGTITKPNDTEILYVFYLGNGSRTITTTDGTITIDFSDQSATGATDKVTNFLIAEHAAKNVHVNGNTITAQADLDVKTAVAYFNLSGFSSDTRGDEIIYLNGTDVYSAATINFNDGSVTGSYKGPINVGTNGEKYVALIASTNAETTLKFDSDTKSGEIAFTNGIESNKFYSAGVSQTSADPLPVAANVVPAEALPGLFSVAPGKMVRFSKGNLQYSRADLNTPWSEGEWSFMENQYDHETSGDVGSEYSGRTAISFFGWGTTGRYDDMYHQNQKYYMPNNTLAYEKPDPNDWSTWVGADVFYGPTGKHDLSVNNHSDWGSSIESNSSWYTMSKAEWIWLLGVKYKTPEDVTIDPEPGVTCRATTNSLGDNTRYTKAKISGMYGIIIFPDSYTHPLETQLNYINYSNENLSFKDDNVNLIDLNDWLLMEAAGAVFIPAAGQRFLDFSTYDTTDVTDVNKGGNYWTSSYANNGSAITLFFDAGLITFNHNYRFQGLNVRLVYDAE